MAKVSDVLTSSRQIGHAGVWSESEYDGSIVCVGRCFLQNELVKQKKEIKILNQDHNNYIKYINNKGIQQKQVLNN